MLARCRRERDEPCAQHTAFFAGIGTVVVAIGAGLGGGLLLGDIMSPQQPKYQSSEVTRLEQRKFAAADHRDEQRLAAGAVSGEPAGRRRHRRAGAAAESGEPPQPQQTSRNNRSPNRPQFSRLTRSLTDTNKAQPANTSRSQQSNSPPPRNAPRRKTPSARARRHRREGTRADVKREMRRADDRRKAERRQQWAEKRRAKPRDDDELRDVEASVRQATEQRPLFGEPRFGSRIGLFEQD